MVKESENSNPIPDIYCELSDLNLLKDKMEESLEYYNQINRVKMNLVLFMAAIETIVKVIRIIRQPNGNALLVGVGGSGRKSASLLAASISDMAVFEIEVTKGFGMSEWREQMIKVFL